MSTSTTAMRCPCGADLPHHLADVGLTEHVCSCCRKYIVKVGRFVQDGTESNPFAGPPVQLLATRDITAEERETLRKLVAEHQAKPRRVSIIPLEHLTGLTVEALQRESYETAKEKGWHDEDDQPPSEAMVRIAAEGLYQAARCRFIEAYRKGERGDDVLAGVDPMGTVATLSDRQVRVIAWLALINTEVAEAIEDVVAGRWQTTRNEKGRPEGLGSELADIIIRACDDAGALGIDLAAELRAKLDYNRTRAHRHGGKLA